MSKTRIIFTIILAVLIGGVALTAKASMFQSKDSVYVGKDEVISSNFFAAGSSITIDGKVQGDVICAGRSITINGFVDGDVICAGQSITINGEIRGNVRAAGSSVTINGKVARNAMVAGSEIHLGTNAEIAWDMMFAGAFADLHGTVKRDLEGAGAKLVIGGQVNRNVSLFCDDNHRKNRDDKEGSNITILKSAMINGDFNYTSSFEAEIEDGATIAGSTTRHDRMMSKPSNDDGAVAAWVWWRVIVMFAALLIGLILVSWLRRPMQAISERMFKKPYATFGYGLLVLIVTPLVCFILLMTVIGIPLALILLALWFIALWIAKIITAIVIGQEIMKRRRSTELQKNNLVLSMVVGVVISYIIFSISIIGWALSLIATLFGLGMIWLYGREKSTQNIIS